MHGLSSLKNLINQKKVLFFSSVILCFIFCFIPANAESPKEGIVNVQYLNVRNGPDSSTLMIGQLLKDTVVQINDTSDNWYNITYKDLTGWVHGDYITLKQQNEEAVKEVAQTTTTTVAESKNEASETSQTPKTGVVTANALNVRDAAGTSAKVIAQLNNGMEVKISAEKDAGDSFTWYKISYLKTEGWVSGEYISFEYNPIDEGAINVDVANVRNGAGLDFEVIAKMKNGDKVNIYAWYDEWYKIKLEDGSFAWIFGELVTARKDLLMRGIIASRGEATTSSLGEQLVSYAKKFLGVRYVWGGTSPNGFDCSGFVQYVYKQFGITLNRVAADQAKQGTKVTRAQLKPGDLLFFNAGSGSGIDHVGMYIGNGQFIHATNGKGKVVINLLNTGFYNGAFVTARRIVE